jgi:serine/threonine protein kinase
MWDTRYLYGIARGLYRLHELSILHHDVKSENIFIDSRGHPRIGDLGTVKLSGTPENTGVRGTTEYMAPKVLAADCPSEPDSHT